MKTTMSATGVDVRKKCKNCLQDLKIYITCFNCDGAYHIYCWKKVPLAYVNKRGQLFCCSSLTSNCPTTDTNLGTQDNPPEKVKEKGNVDGYNEGLENCPIKQEDTEWNEFKGDACHLEYTNEEYLENHHSECPNKEGKFIQELKEDEDLESCLHKEEDLECNDIKCDPCLLEFTNKEHLENHCSEYPNKQGGSVPDLYKDKGALFCLFCKKETFQKESYEQHIKLCHGECSSSPLKKDDGIHISNTKGNPAQVYDKEKKYKRTISNYSAHIKGYVVKRICIHNNEGLFKCGMCDYTAKENETLKRHFSSKHINEKEKYDSTVCTFSTSSEDASQSCRQIYITEKPFKCDLCEYATVQRINLKIHSMSKHSSTGKEHKCRYCKYSTYIKTVLVNHMHTHTKERPFKCGVCDYAAVRKDTLNVHTLVKHSNGDKGYKCTDCEYFTHVVANLAKHMRTHTNEKPFKCNMCDYVAAQKKSLNFHILVKHSNADKKYKCGNCGYSTYRKDSLKRHVRTHIKEKPFKCNICDYAAVKKTALKKHVVVKHSKKSMDNVTIQAKEKGI